MYVGTQRGQKELGAVASFLFYLPAKPGRALEFNGPGSQLMAATQL